MMIRDHVISLICEALEVAQSKGKLPPSPNIVIEVEHPQKPEYGDFATNLPLRLARTAGKNPIEIANEIAMRIPESVAITDVWVAHPGFINFSLNAAWLRNQIQVILDHGQTYGNVKTGRQERIQLEFVSVNPTGPLHVGHARGAVLGSTLANILAAAGFNVVREYFINDAGNQINRFCESLYARYLQALAKEADMPPDGYMGSYLVDTAQEIVLEHGDHFMMMPEGQGTREVGEIGLRRMLEMIRQDLEDIGVEFEVWFTERSLFQKGQYEKSMALLRNNDHVIEREGAVWFASSALGDDKDSVLVRSSGVPTYFASDMAYHYNKFMEREFQRVINIWGADHQGHVPRMKAVISALGINPDRLAIIISQMVTIKHGDAVVRASKRSGQFITLHELVQEVGRDACRYFFLARAADTPLEFDLELARRESNENPVFYVQYAHARLCNILRIAKDRGLIWQEADVSLLTNAAELSLIRKMILLPELIENMAQNLQAHPLPHYASELATSVHSFYDHCRVLSKDSEHTEIAKARLKLVEAARFVLSRTLELMGMSAPEQM